MLNPDLKVGDRVVLVYMSEEVGMHPGTKGTVTDIARDPFEGLDDKIISVDWDNGRTLGMVTITDMWMKEKETVNEQDEIDSSFSKSTAKISPFNTSATATCEAMKLALESYGIPFAEVGKPGKIKLPGVEESIQYKTESQQRFIQWYSDVIKNPDSVTSRGKSFEGLIGGVFNGKVENFEGEADKTDVSAQGKNISIKFSQNFNPEGGQSLGGVTRAIKAAVESAGPEVQKVIQTYKLNKISSTNVGFAFEVLLSKPFGKEFLKDALDKENSFRTIDYFMFANYEKLNEISVYQYRKNDILNHIVNGNYTFNGGIISIKNLSSVPNRILLVQFPQYTKTKRQKYKFNTKGISVVFSEEPTLAITIKDNGKVVGKVLRSLDTDGNPSYTIQSDKNFSKDLELEAINRALLKDINSLTNSENEEDKNLLKKLQSLSDQKSKELFVLKSRTSDTGREKGIKQLFGGRGENLNPFVIQNIRKNPERFFKKAFEIYGCDSNGVNKIEKALKNVFGVDLSLPIAQYCTTGNVAEISKKLKESLITENIEDMRKISDLVKIMNLNVVYDFFEKLRMSGLVNMLGSVAFTWSGRQYLEKFIDIEEMKGFEIDPDQKEELLEAADKIQMEIIRASMKVLEKEGKEDTIENINRTARDLGKKMLMFFIQAR